MSWNYRTVAYRNSEEENGWFYTIEEVYYDKDGSISGWTTDKSIMFGESNVDLEWILSECKDALRKPIIYLDAERKTIIKEE